MGFDILQSGTMIEIVLSQHGAYESFENVRAEIVRREKTLVIRNIIISADGVRWELPDGLKKIQSGLRYEEIFYTEGLEDVEKELLEKQKMTQQEKREVLERAKKTGDWDDVPSEIIYDAVADIILTTSMFVAGRAIEKELDVITHECVYGMNIFRDMFASVRDVVGGRGKAVEKVLRDARISAMRGLREEALMLGADAVIALDLDYSELGGGGKSGMLVAIASGTAVRLSDIR